MIRAARAASVIVYASGRPRMGFLYHPSQVQGKNQGKNQFGKRIRGRLWGWLSFARRMTGETDSDFANGAHYATF